MRIHEGEPQDQSFGFPMDRTVHIQLIVHSLNSAIESHTRSVSSRNIHEHSLNSALS